MGHLTGSDHKQDIVDHDSLCTIDPQTRKVTNETLKNILLQYDHNSERVSFTMERTIEDHDMSKSDRITVFYVNGPSSGSYIVDDMKLSEDGNSITFSWLISRAATQNVGTLVFAINFRCIDEEGNITYSWSTQPCPMFSILAGVTGSEDVTYDEYNDLIGHFENELNYILEELEAVKKLVGVNTKHTYHFANIVMGYASATTIPSEETEE